MPRNLRLHAKPGLHGARRGALASHPWRPAVGGSDFPMVAWPGAGGPGRPGARPVWPSWACYSAKPQDPPRRPSRGRPRPGQPGLESGSLLPAGLAQWQGTAPSQSAANGERGEPKSKLQFRDHGCCCMTGDSDLDLGARLCARHGPNNSPSNTAIMATVRTVGDCRFGTACHLAKK